MKRMIQWVLAATLICGASVFTSCSLNEDSPVVPVEPDLNLAEKVIGKWIVAELEGLPCPTNLKATVTFVSPTKAYGSLSDIYSLSWNEEAAADITINGNKMSMISKEDEHTTHVLDVTVTSITDTDMVLSSDWIVLVDGKEVYHEVYGQERWVRVTKDYSDDIIGIWEGRITNSEGSEFDDGENHRWEYLADGNFRFYREVDGQWQLSDDEFSNYFVDGNLLCTRWKNKGEGQEEHREWWEIESIKDGVMKWTALRLNEDATFYTATFEMTKVSNIENDNDGQE